MYGPTSTDSLDGNSLSGQSYYCGSKIYDCETDTFSDAVDADIAGIGVIIAFLATAVFTFVAILIAYLTDSLPEQTPKSKLDTYFVSGFRRVFLRSKKGDSVNIEKKRRRQGALEGFILALSDQQLVTGLALLIAGFSKCDITIYSFNIVSALAWFSCTTHLTTLTVLKRYLNAHPVVRIIRIIGMILVAGLLITAQVLSSVLNYDFTARFYCALRAHNPNPPGPFAAIGLSFVVLWLVVTYSNRLIGLYDRDPSSGKGSWLYRHLMQRHGADIVRGEAQKELLEEVSKAPAISLLLRYRAILSIYHVACEELVASFIWELIWLVFGATYGITQIVMFWIGVDSDTDSKAVLHEMGFGQMVPLLLLALPFFSALEGVYQVKDYTTVPLPDDTELQEHIIAIEVSSAGQGSHPPESMHGDIIPMPNQTVTELEMVSIDAGLPPSQHDLDPRPVARISTFDLGRSEAGLARRDTGVAQAVGTSTSAAATPVNHGHNTRALANANLETWLISAQRGDPYQIPWFATTLWKMGSAYLFSALWLGIIFGGALADLTDLQGTSYPFLFVMLLPELVVRGQEVVDVFKARRENKARGRQP